MVLKNSKKIKKLSNYNLFILGLVMIVVIVIVIIKDKHLKKNKEFFNDRYNIFHDIEDFKKELNYYKRNNKDLQKKIDKLTKLKKNNKVNPVKSNGKIEVNNNCVFKHTIDDTDKNILSYMGYNDKQLSKAHERIINPLLPPERSYQSTYGIPINIPSRGLPDEMQQIGVLHKESIESENMKSGNNNDSVILALFGSPTYKGSNKWTYYTSSNMNQAVKIPLKNKGQKCDSSYGCEELHNDDLISVPGYNGMFRCTIYDYDVPKYIPYL